MVIFECSLNLNKFDEVLMAVHFVLSPNYIYVVFFSLLDFYSYILSFVFQLHKVVASDALVHYACVYLTW